jgi:hypothetical protein
MESSRHRSCTYNPKRFRVHTLGQSMIFQPSIRLVLALSKTQWTGPKAISSSVCQMVLLEIISYQYFLPIVEPPIRRPRTTRMEP